MVAAPERAPAATAQRVVSRGQELELSQDAFGDLRRSDDLLPPGSAPAQVASRVEALRERMAQDGYLFLPGYLDREEVLGARRELCTQLAGYGLIRTDRPLEEAYVVPDATLPVRGADVAKQNQSLQRLLYASQGRMMSFYRAYLGGEVRHFDYSWLRIVRPGKGTASHCDLVFMGRGTTNLYTSWTPLGDIDRRLGGLIVLEGSHRRHDLTGDYLKTDVDTYCENRFDGAWTAPDGTRNRPDLATGHITEDHVELRQRFGGRWLTADFRAGDLLVFGMALVHASLDNQSPDRLRLSSDTRYQLASEPVDERWIGEEPLAHGQQSARGVIC